MSSRGPVIAIGSRHDPFFYGTVERLAAHGVDHCTIDLESNWLEHVSFDLALDGRVRLPQGERICIGDRSVSLDNIAGVLLRYLAWAPPGTLSDPRGMFISSELCAMFRFLAHRLRCTVINRVRPELWAFHLIDGPQLKRMVPVAMAAPSATVYASTIDGSGLTGVRHVPFSQPEFDFAIEGLSAEALARIVKTVPLRLVPRGSVEEIEVYVVGDVIHGARSVPNDVAAASRDIARALGLTFCRMAWAADDDGALLLRWAQIFPCYEHNGVPLDAICDSLAEELMR